MTSRAAFISQLADTIRPSLQPGNDAEACVRQWLKVTVPALGWKKPIELIGTAAGREQVRLALERSVSGAYA